MKNANYACATRKYVYHKFARILHRLKLVLSAKLRDPLGVLDVILVEDTVQLNDIAVYIEADLNGVVHHKRNGAHVKPEVDHKGFKAESTR